MTTWSSVRDMTQIRDRCIPELFAAQQIGVAQEYNSAPPQPLNVGIKSEMTGARLAHTWPPLPGLLQPRERWPRLERQLQAQVLPVPVPVPVQGGWRRSSAAALRRAAIPGQGQPW